jgi:hypothetical protein
MAPGSVQMDRCQDISRKRNTGKTEAARFLIEGVGVDPWLAMEHPLPHDLHLAALQELHSIFYALLPALDFTVDAAAPLIGRLMEIDRRIVLIERLRPFNC